MAEQGLTAAERKRIFEESLAEAGFANAYGTPTVAALRAAFVKMHARLAAHGATATDRRRFVEAIVRAINDAPELFARDRLALVNTLHSAFDGTTHETTLRSANCLFLASVTFDED